MSESKYDVICGKRGIRVSKHLLASQDVEHNLEKIKDLHRHKLEIYNYLDERGDSINDIKLMVEVKKIENIEFSLQELWGFEKSKIHHRFWDTPGCKCPKLDNDDNYPSGFYYTNTSCRLHGTAKRK